MVNCKILAGSRKKALSVHTYALSKLLFAGSMPEISCRSSNIVYIPLEISIFSHSNSFINNGFVASYLNYPSLMKC